MQDNSDYKKSYDYFVSFIREALKEGISFDAITDDKIRRVVHEEVKFLLNAHLKDGLSFSYLNSFLKNSSGNIGWLKSDQALLTFHSKLISYGFVAVNFLEFQSHFVGVTAIRNPLRWFGQTNQLSYLFEQLRTFKIIPTSENPHQLIKEHFLDKKGRGLKGENLRSSLNQVRNGKGIKEINNIIDVIQINQ